ncbi:MAG: hypothetical protein ACI39H_03355 [Lachnospiraceae bacterium]
MKEVKQLVNEEKVRMMTKLAIYEEGRGKTAVSIGQYYKKDYIAKQMIKSLFLGTIAFMILAGLWISNGLDGLLADYLSLNLERMMMVFLILYAVFMFCYLGITWLISSYRYRRSEKLLKVYDKALKRLENMYG